MGTLYINQDDVFIGKTDERLNVKAKNQKIQDVPLIHLDGVVILGRATISPGAIAELLERKIPLTNNFLMVQAPGFIRGINPKSKIENPQAPAFIRGVNLKSKI